MCAASSTRSPAQTPTIAQFLSVSEPRSSAARTKRAATEVCVEELAQVEKRQSGLAMSFSAQPACARAPTRRRRVCTDRTHIEIVRPPPWRHTPPQGAAAQAGERLQIRIAPGSGRSPGQGSSVKSGNSRKRGTAGEPRQLVNPGAPTPEDAESGKAVAQHGSRRGQGNTPRSSGRCSLAVYMRHSAALPPPKSRPSVSS